MVPGGGGAGRSGQPEACARATRGPDRPPAPGASGAYHPGPPPPAVPPLGTRRLTALSDGVFAIAMTLLVLDVTDAAVAAPDGAAWDAVGPQLASYVLGFVVLGLLWNGHHVAFAHVEHVDRPLLWLNVAFLLFAALVPFPAELIARWPVAFSAVAVYGAVLTCAALALLAAWTYAVRAGLVGPAVGPATVRGLQGRLVRAVALYGAGVAVAWWSPPAGVAVLFASHLFFVARPVDAVEVS